MINIHYFSEVYEHVRLPITSANVVAVIRGEEKTVIDQRNGPACRALFVKWQESRHCHWKRSISSGERIETYLEAFD